MNNLNPNLYPKNKENKCRKNWEKEAKNTTKKKKRKNHVREKRKRTGVGKGGQ